MKPLNEKGACYPRSSRNFRSYEKGGRGRRPARRFLAHPPRRLVEDNRSPSPMGRDGRRKESAKTPHHSRKRSLEGGAGTDQWHTAPPTALEGLLTQNKQPSAEQMPLVSLLS
ncbi:hypothetical protein TNCT_323701 [Trichonephila clavata]|uniref:Uncharacterized protein n=1 Tax=Trichonephila clavata TaxID=2740835 RepID=A0A8X6IZD5_TRICU|nr:hypothetical protein TNCT_323701 [Trichonephila clavata]